MLAPEIIKEIEKEAGHKIIMTAPLSTAHDALIYRLTLDDNTFLVAKVASTTAKKEALDIEAFMLDYLREHSELPLPEVIYSDPSILVMEYIDAVWNMDSSAEEHAAQLLADLHNIKGKQFGFERDTLIGSLHQPNPPMDNWIDFFGEHRLLYMGGKALEDGIITSDLMKKIEKLVKKLPNFLPKKSSPKLIHGDVWSGNVLAVRGKIKAFLDPAIYYADPEIEIAFTTLFETFSPHFYHCYSEVHPIDQGFIDERKDIYNLYPLLVHCRLFGRSYARKVEKSLDKFI